MTNPRFLASYVKLMQGCYHYLVTKPWQTNAPLRSEIRMRSN